MAQVQVDIDITPSGQMIEATATDVTGESFTWTRTIHKRTLTLDTTKPLEITAVCNTGYIVKSAFIIGTHEKLPIVRPNVFAYTPSSSVTSVAIGCLIDSLYTTLKAGTYRFKNILNLPTMEDIGARFEFKTGNKVGNRITPTSALMIYGLPDITVVYSNKKQLWNDEKYRTIQVDSDVQVDTYFYNWAINDGNLEVVDTSQLEVVLYQNTAEKVRVDKTNYLKTIAKIQGTLRDVTSLTHLVLTIEYPLPNFNYAYIAMFNRYYFVSGIKAVKYGLWEVSMSVDVLMTYKEALKNCYAMINRNEYDFNQFIIDNQIPFQQGQEVTIYDIIDNKLFDSNIGSYVLQGLLVAPGDKI